MKKILFIIICAVCTSIGSAQKAGSGEVNFISEADGSITVSAIGYGSNVTKAKEDAALKVIDAVLFRGIPESKQKVALLGTDFSEHEFKKSDYYNDFITKNRYWNFIMMAVAKSKLEKQKGGKKIMSTEIKINVAALRLDLEQHNMLRKFGF